MKKVMIVFIVLIMIMGLGTAASAATLSDVVTALNNTDLPAVYVSQFESYFSTHEITSSQADDFIKYINKADAVMGGKAWSTMTKTQGKAIFENVALAAKSAGLTAAYNYDEVFAIFDKTGKLVVAVSKDSLSETPASAIKQTGHDYSIMLIGLAFILLAVAIAAVTKLQKRVSRFGSI